MTPNTLDRSLAEPMSPTIVVAAPARQSPRFRLSPGLLVAIVVALGFLGRVGSYARNPSFWIDEAMLALNLIERTPSELLQPLDRNQGAPLGFLLISKFVIALFGNSEYALRALPLLASLVGLGLFVPFAYRVLPLVPARLAVVLFALSPYLMGYAAEFKQYGLDATIALGLVMLGRRGANLGLALAGALAVWFSHPAVFVLGGVGSVLLLDGFSNREMLRRNVGTVGTWLLSFAVCYWFFLRKLGLNRYLLDYWDGSFLPMPPIRPGDFAWIVHHFLLFFDKPGGFGGEFGLAGFAGVCCLIGAIALAKSDWRLLVALVLPFLLAMIASGFRKYPFAGRLMLFAVPLAIPLVAHGAVLLANRVRDLGSAAMGIVLVAVCLGSVGECNNLRKQPLHSEEIREVVEVLAQSWQPGDRVYVYYGAVPGFAYYRLRFPIPEEAVMVGRENRGKDPRQFQREIEQLRGCSRVWVVLAHRQPSEEAAIRAYLESMGNGEPVRTRNDAVLLRYNLVRE